MPKNKKLKKEFKYLSPEKEQEIYEKLKLFQKNPDPSFPHQTLYPTNTPFEQLNFLYYDGSKIYYKGTP